MALQINYTDPATKVAAPACYARILSIHINVVDQIIDVEIGLYVDAAARAAGGTPLATFHGWPAFGALMTGPVNIPVAAYQYLKGLAPFLGATDV